jgi:hypothetical protein
MDSTALRRPVPPDGDVRRVQATRLTAEFRKIMEKTMAIIPQIGLARNRVESRRDDYILSTRGSKKPVAKAEKRQKSESPQAGPAEFSCDSRQVRTACAY